MKINLKNQKENYTDRGELSLDYLSNKDILAMNLCLLKLIREVNPFCNRELYLRYLHTRYLFILQAHNAYMSHQMQSCMRNLEIRMYPSFLEKDIADLTGSYPTPKGNDHLMSSELDNATALGWILVSEAIASFSPHFLEKAQIIGFHETYGARHLAGTAALFNSRWRQTCIHANAMIRDGVAVDELQAAISRILRHLQMLAEKELKNG
ncbi:hypothetical protein [uncultured Cohaesibacter sp.]|uniref:hypothetical protein n=1 Tax=uncultured Cohaesibacter sp. TaxID=1002546 RepID=UPI0029C82F5B|nr:hypothetical protein [uncultured Cohaesibacter sp.]